MQRTICVSGLYCCFQLSLRLLGATRIFLSNFALQPGDLLFQDSDCGPLCDAIERVTIGHKGANFSHCGIVTKNDSGDFSVIEAVSKGVVVTPLRTFLGRSFDARHQPKVVVGRVKEPYQHLIRSALKEGLSLKGKPYDKVFAIGNEAYYCSELIYEIFSRANTNKSVFKLQPMTYKDPDTGEILTAWEDYFSKLGVSTPEGKLGINPGSISCSPVLTIIFAYGNPSRRILDQR
ncbi:MAG: YiiX/YebB-like N1pC/P60 family cysteine hydrolase [Planctomycetota bacterium]